MDQKKPLEEILEEKNTLINLQSRININLRKDLRVANNHMQKMLELNSSLEKFLHLLPESEREDYLNNKTKVQACAQYLEKEYARIPMYRNMVRVTEVQEKYVKVCLPGWDYKVEFTLYKSNLPQDLVKEMVVDFRCYAYIPGLVEDPEEIFFEDWQFKPDSEKLKSKFT